jgi:hypothetical protein
MDDGHEWPGEESPHDPHSPDELPTDDLSGAGDSYPGSGPHDGYDEPGYDGDAGLPADEPAGADIPGHGADEQLPGDTGSDADRVEGRGPDGSDGEEFGDPDGPADSDAPGPADDNADAAGPADAAGDADADAAGPADDADASAGDAGQPPDGDRADGDPAGDAGDGDGGDGGDVEDSAGAFGAGLDTAGDHDGSWHDDEFPAELDLGMEPPEPVDGFPWADADLLGQPDPTQLPELTADFTAVGPDDLLSYAGLELTGDADPWQLLLGSDDPATSALARWWGPAG